MIIPPRASRLTVVSLLVALTAGTLSQARPADSTAARRVRPGVLYRTIVRSAGPWRIHILEIDLNSRDLSIRSVHAFDSARGRETTGSIARRFPDSLGTVVAALNADFFQLESGETVNNQISEGRPIRVMGDRHPLPRSQFGVTWNGRPFIARIRLKGSITARGVPPIPLGGVNTLPDSGGISLLTPEWGSRLPDSVGRKPLVSVPFQDAGRRGDTLLLVRRVAAVEAETQRGFWITSRMDGSHAWLASVGIADTILAVEGVADKFRNIRTLVGGTPRIVQDGVNVAGIPAYMEGTPQEFSTRRHPRTGVGFSRDSTKVIFLVVDGRQQASVGMSLPEFADLMLEAGVWQGLNLDGGGSTVMVVEGKVVNVPSDPSGERPVANCLLLIASP